MPPPAAVVRVGKSALLPSTSPRPIGKGSVYKSFKIPTNALNAMGDRRLSTGDLDIVEESLENQILKISTKSQMRSPY